LSLFLAFFVHPLIPILLGSSVTSSVHICYFRGRKEMCGGFWCGKLKERERDHLKDLGRNGKIMFKRRLQKLDGVSWSVLMWLRMWALSGSAEGRNYPSGSTKCGKCLNWLKNWFRLKWLSCVQSVFCWDILDLCLLHIER
jgi:hypothetical protein